MISSKGPVQISTENTNVGIIIMKIWKEAHQANDSLKRQCEKLRRQAKNLTILFPLISSFYFNLCKYQVKPKKTKVKSWY